ncbi:MAG: hypothetical protein IKB20_01500 [Clostridia bacterium]|nr:hypothetical protein [Clostridia bacterium]
MAQQVINNSVVVAVDMRRQVLHYYTMLGDDRASISHRVKNYKAKGLEEDFFAKMKDALAAFVAEEPFEETQKAVVVMPDETVALDCLRLPNMRNPKHLQNAVNVKLSEIYKNRAELKLLAVLADKNRQFCTYNVAAMQRSILDSVTAVCAEQHLIAEPVTYASASTAVAVGVLAPQYKTATYLFLDIKDVYSRFIFVSAGKTVGFFTLPFGLEFLSAKKCKQEDMLFDHRYAELVVINAKERAKSKKLSILAETSDLASMQIRSLQEEEDSEETLKKGKADKGTQQDIKVLAKKTPRKLPQFMLRPTPTDAEGVMQENFRIFVKWALSLLQNNTLLTAPNTPKCVLVNLPQAYQHIFDKLAEEEKETGVPFIRFDGADDDQDLANHLELFGGLYVKNFPASAKF